MKFRVGDQIVELESSGRNVEVGSDRVFITTDAGKKSAVVMRDGRSILISYDGRAYRLDSIDRSADGKSVAGPASGELRSLIPGVVVSVPVTLGDKVAKGTTVVVLEAMKTQQPLVAPFDGIVTTLNVAEGDRVGDNALVAVVSAADVPGSQGVIP
jgi:acetyl/propionyl-CoA carboxylase alpha subunit